MSASVGPRLALEAAFLIVVGIVSGLADLRPAVIIGVMAAAWLLVSLIEYTASRLAREPAAPSYAGYATRADTLVAAGAPQPELEIVEAVPALPPETEQRTEVVAPDDEPGGS